MAKTLEFKTLPFQEGGGSLDYKEVLKMAVKNPKPEMQQDGRYGPGTFDFDGLYAALKLMDKLVAANGSVELTDEDAAYIVARVKAMTWLVADPAIGEFLTDVLKLE